MDPTRPSDPQTQINLLNRTQDLQTPPKSTLDASGIKTVETAEKVQKNIKVPSNPKGTRLPEPTTPEPTAIEKTNNVANKTFEVQDPTGNPAGNPGESLAEIPSEDAAAPSLFATLVTYLPTAQDAISGTVTAVSSLFIYRLLDKKTYNFGRADALCNFQKKGETETSLKPNWLPAGLKVIKFAAGTVIGTTLQTIAMSILFSDSISFMPASNRTYGKNFAFTAVLFLMQEVRAYSKLEKGQTYFKKSLEK